MKVIVVGAGMAGHQAARTLADAGVEVEIVEARKRAGGRTYTDRSFAPIPIELGAEFVHGRTQSTGALVEKLGLKTVPWSKTTDSFIQVNPGDPLITMSQARKENPDLDRVRAWNFERPPIQPEGESFANYLRRAGFNDREIHFFRRAYCNALGEDPEKLDAQQALHEADTYAGEDLKMLDGYDTVLTHLSKNIPIHTGEPVESIHWGNGVTLKTASEKTFEADAVILTVPVGVLKSHRIEFYPLLPDSKEKALERLTMATFTKMIYCFEEPIAPPEAFAIYSAHNPPTWWSPSFGRTDLHIWSAFFSGRWAKELLCLTAEEALEIGLETLRKTVGREKLSATKAKLVNWLGDPYAMGGYTACRPGGFHARFELGKPTPPLFWAGEGTGDSGTVHTAFDSGTRAAQETLAFLK